MFCHACAGGAIASLVYRQLLSTLGIRKALAIFTAVDAVAFLCGYLMLEERRPKEKRPPLVWFDRAFFADPVFWSLALCFFFTVLCVLLLVTFRCHGPIACGRQRTMRY